MSKRSKPIGLWIVKGQRADSGDFLLDPKSQFVLSALLIVIRRNRIIDLPLVSHYGNLYLLSAPRHDFDHIVRSLYGLAVNGDNHVSCLRARILLHTHDQGAFYTHLNAYGLSSGYQHSLRNYIRSSRQYGKFIGKKYSRTGNEDNDAGKEKDTFF